MFAICFEPSSPRVSICVSHEPVIQRLVKHYNVAPQCLNDKLSTFGANIMVSEKNEIDTKGNTSRRLQVQNPSSLFLLFPLSLSLVAARALGIVLLDGQ